MQPTRQVTQATPVLAESPDSPLDADSSSHALVQAHGTGPAPVGLYEGGGMLRALQLPAGCLHACTCLHLQQPCRV